MSKPVARKAIALRKKTKKSDYGRLSQGICDLRKDLKTSHEHTSPLKDAGSTVLLNPHKTKHMCIKRY